jgi:hypothetical protein
MTNPSLVEPLIGSLDHGTYFTFHQPFRHLERGEKMGPAVTAETRLLWWHKAHYSWTQLNACTLK